MTERPPRSLTRGAPPAVICSCHQRYTDAWILERGLDATQVPGSQLEGIGAAEAGRSMTVWLPNVDRVIAHVSKYVPLSELKFTDVGCGRGIPCLYVAERYDFASVDGFDFDSRLVRSAQANAAELKRRRGEATHVTFYEANALTERLDPERRLVFMLNPFSTRVLSRFVERNRRALKAGSSFFAMVNDHGIETVIALGGQLVWRSPMFNCSVVAWELD
jgi:SAM-dependent methyltransferase